jgi:hypothetical protein
MGRRCAGRTVGWFLSSLLMSGCSAICVDFCACSKSEETPAGSKLAPKVEITPAVRIRSESEGGN